MLTPLYEASGRFLFFVFWLVTSGLNAFTDGSGGASASSLGFHDLARQACPGGTPGGAPRGYCHACSRSPSLALEGARLHLITPTCHHHYVQQHSLDSPGLLPFVDCHVYKCLFPRLFPVSALMLCVHVQTLSCPVLCPYIIKCLLPVPASRLY